MLAEISARAVSARTDKYFTKTRNVVTKFGDKRVKGGVFLRHPVICAVQPAIDLIHQINADGVKIMYEQLFEEGALVAAEKPILLVQGPMSQLVELETLILQRVGASCLSAYNAYKMCRILPKAGFLDMHARHATGDDMTMACAYGASIGSKAARMQGAVGFIGSSQDLTAPFYGAVSGVGTMPHALIGYAGSTVAAMQMFIEANPSDTDIVVLVDYFGREITDALAAAERFYGVVDGKYDPDKNWSRFSKKLSVRLDTHGGRFAEGLDYEKSIQIVANWLHVDGKWETVRTVMGDDAYDVADDVMRDQVAKVLFGTGVSAANIINMRNALDRESRGNVKIVASSGFNLRKCKIMANARAPIDVVGTGSFLPEKWSDTYATLDYFSYDDQFSVKTGREAVFLEHRPVNDDVR